MAKRIARLSGLVIGIVAALAAPFFRAHAEDPPGPELKLVLVETVAEAAGGRWTSVAPGAISETNEEEGRAADYGWSAPPATIGEDGFALTLTTGAQAGSKPFEGGARAAGTDFKFDPDPAVAELKLEAGQSDTVTKTVQVTPRWGLTDGEIVDLAVGVQWGPSVHYRYRVTHEQPDRLAHEEDDLTADLDCARRIEISHLPSLNCHVSISGWKRGGGPVHVVLPEALDAFGNHANGIQISGAGERDADNMGEPYGWGLMIFACPGTQGPGVNCAGHATAPGPTRTPIVVRQEGRKDVTLMLELDAEGEALAGDGAPVAPDDAIPPQGALEARLDCPSTISISAPQGISCNIVISNWRRDTTDPVFVLLPGAVDSFGNHANGLQVKTEESERVFGWEPPHLWSISVFACPGINCFSRETKPGPASIDIVLRQNGMTDAKLTLALDAVAPPPPVAPN